LALATVSRRLRGPWSRFAAQMIAPAAGEPSAAYTVPCNGSPLSFSAADLSAGLRRASKQMIPEVPMGLPPNELGTHQADRSLLSFINRDNPDYRLTTHRFTTFLTSASASRSACPPRCPI